LAPDAVSDRVYTSPSGARLHDAGKQREADEEHGDRGCQLDSTRNAFTPPRASET
jgi:hypothetical protein